jgi:large subunit ribosomal protein L25
MSDILLKAEPRTTLGGATAKTLRAQGRVPGVLYGHGEASTAFHVKELDLRPLIYTQETHVLKLALGSEETRCILREIQFDPITDRINHIDLLILHAGEKISIDVPVIITGSSVGVRDGGIVDHVMHKLTINVLPDAIPESITIDITDLKIGQSIHIKELPATDQYTVLGDENAVIVAVVPPKISEEAAVPQTEVTEPEQIQAKGKKEEEAAPEKK